MSRTRKQWLTSVFLTATTLWGTGVRAAGESPEEVLSRSGLEQVGPLYVLKGEQDVKKKLAQVKQLSRQMRYARLQQESYGTAQDHQALIQNLTAQVAQIKADIATAGQQMNRLPRFRGRFANMYVQEEHAELMAYRNQLNAELGQQNALLNQVKSHPPDPKMKDKLAADARARQDDYQKAVTDLVQLVGTTQEKYGALAKDAEVKKALEALELKIRPSPKLGPSHEFHETVKLVDKLERDTGDSSSESKTKTVHKPRRSARPAP
jgi:hypothetical protein